MHLVHLVHGRRQQTERELAYAEIEFHDEKHNSYNSIEHDAIEEDKSQIPYPARPKYQSDRLDWPFSVNSALDSSPHLSTWQ